jgi:hypothetical protein
VKIHELLRKINDAVRPVHVGERGPSIDDLNADATGTIKGRGAPPTGYLPSQQDEGPRD